MKQVREAWLIQIEVTNACILSCAHCTRSVRHIEKPFYISLDHLENALKSLNGWNKPVGLIGGEPTIHPQFVQICELMKKYLPKKHRGLWSAGGKRYEQHKELIDETFGVINFNNHKMECFHQPMLIGSEEVIPDEVLRKELINDCWLQREWSPSIGPNGAFFCEVAQSYDLIFEEHKGLPLVQDWWKKDLSSFEDQINTFCNRCSVCIPFESNRDVSPFEYISPKNLERLKKANSPYIAKNKGEMKVFDKILTREDIVLMKGAQKKATENQYISKSDKENYFFVQFGKVDTRLDWKTSDRLARFQTYFDKLNEEKKKDESQ